MCSRYVAGNDEMLQIIESVAGVKNVQRENVITALEKAISTVAHRKYGTISIKATIDRKKGEIQLFRQLLVVDKIEEEPEINEDEDESEVTKGLQSFAEEVPSSEKSGILPKEGGVENFASTEGNKSLDERGDNQENKKWGGKEKEEEVEEESEEKRLTKVLLEEAHIDHPDAKVGDIILVPLPPFELGRSGANLAKQIIFAEMRKLEAEKHYKEFKTREGEILSGVIDKLERGNVVLKIGTAEIGINRHYLLREDNFRQGDRIKAYLVSVERGENRTDILLSRTHPEFVSQLFAQEVPEVYDQTIQVKAVAREAGVRTKIAVYCSDSSLDAVGSCVGVRGARVQAVMAELKGERIDIVPWSSDLGTFVLNAIAPAKVEKIVLDEDNKSIEVVVAEDQLSIAIGRGGQNVRLASSLVGWKIDVIAEEAESKRRSEEFSTLTQTLMEALDVDKIIAELLSSEGFTIEKIISSSVNDLSSLLENNDEIAQEIISRAKNYQDQGGGGKEEGDAEEDNTEVDSVKEDSGAGSNQEVADAEEGVEEGVGEGGEKDVEPSSQQDSSQQGAQEQQVAQEEKTSQEAEASVESETSK